MDNQQQAKEQGLEILPLAGAQGEEGSAVTRHLRPGAVGVDAALPAGRGRGEQISPSPSGSYPSCGPSFLHSWQGTRGGFPQADPCVGVHGRAPVSVVCSGSKTRKGRDGGKKKSGRGRGGGTPLLLPLSFPSHPLSFSSFHPALFGGEGRMGERKVSCGGRCSETMGEGAGEGRKEGS
jgi:hypothetical protein